MCHPESARGTNTDDPLLLHAWHAQNTTQAMTLLQAISMPTERGPALIGKWAVLMAPGHLWPHKSHVQRASNGSYSITTTHWQVGSADGALRVCGCEHDDHKNAGQNGLHAPGLALDNAIGSVDVVGSAQSSIET